MPSHAPDGRLRRAIAALTTAAVACTLALTPAVAASAAVVTEPVTTSADDATIAISPLGTFETGVFDASAAEIVQAYRDRLFVVNAQAGSVSVLDYADPTTMSELFRLSSAGVANSIAIRADGLGVIAFEAEVKTDPGHLVFFDANAADAASAVLGTVTVGALPDMVTISADGAYAVIANEAEPADDFSRDPEGSISVVALPAALAAPAQDAVRTADFHAFEAEGALPADVRVFGPAPEADFPVSRNLEPEYITVIGGTAYATLQEANAIAVVDLSSATVTDIHPLGFKDHGVIGLDASDRDPRSAPTFNIATYPGLKGIYMPDAISSYTSNGTTYLVTANEGDAREWGDYAEPVRVADLAEDGYGPVCADSPLAGSLGADKLGRLNVTKENGFDEDRQCYSELYAFGGRSFSIWTTDGALVWDSGSSFEQVTHDAAPAFFNSNHSEANLEGRSDDKGPEAESVAIGQVGGRTYAFVGFERVGGVAAYDITDPAASRFVTYVNNRDFAVASGSAAGDLGPEGIAFIPAATSPTGDPLLAVGNEVSGSTTVFEITDLLATTDIQVLTINDFHGRLEADNRNGVAGAAVVAGAVKSFEAQNPNTLFVSAGDNIGASTFTSFISQDTPTIDALVAAGLDVSAVGNHEFDQGYDDIVDRVLPRFGGDQYGLGANVYLKGTTTPALREYAVEEVDGVRVAFIGTVTKDTSTLVTPTGIANLEFGDQVEAANRVAAEITAADAADVIVLLTHSGAEDSDCAAVAGDTGEFGALTKGASAEIDAIVSAHTHKSYACLVPGPDATPRPVIQALEYGKTLGKLDISVNTASKELVSIEPSLVPLVQDGAAAFPADAAVAEIVADAAAVAEVEGSVKVGKISADILRGGATPGSDRGVESSLGNLIADVYLWATTNEDYAGTPAQIGVMNPGGLRDDLLYGEDGTVSYRDVADVQPFANTLVTVTLDGGQLRQLLEEQWRANGSKLHLGVSEGFTYEYDAAAPAGVRIGEMSLNGKVIADGDTFTVVTNSFLAAGGDAFAAFAEGTDRTDTGQADLTATVEYFEAHPVVDPAPLGRSVNTATAPGEPGSAWATVTLGSSSVPQGGALTVQVSDLDPGQQIGATLYSDPIVVTGIPVADASGRTSFQVAIPADLPLGAHRLVITSGSLTPIEVGVTVTAATGGAAAGSAAGSLPATGAELPLGIALAAALLLVAGGLLFATRRRATA